MVRIGVDGSGHVDPLCALRGEFSRGGRWPQARSGLDLSSSRRYGAGEARSCFAAAPKRSHETEGERC